MINLFDLLEGFFCITGIATWIFILLTIFKIWAEQ